MLDSAFWVKAATIEQMLTSGRITFAEYRWRKNRLLNKYNIR